MTGKSARVEQVLTLYAGGNRQAEIARRTGIAAAIVCKIIGDAVKAGDPRVKHYKKSEKKPAPDDYVTCRELGIEIMKYPPHAEEAKQISLPRISCLEKDLPG